MKNILFRLMLAPVQALSLRKVRTWLRVQRLEHKVRVSWRFQKYCEKIKCHNLATLEENHREELLRKLTKAKQPDDSLTPQNLSLHINQNQTCPTFLLNVSTTNPTQKVK